MPRQTLTQSTRFIPEPLRPIRMAPLSVTERERAAIRRVAQARGEPMQRMMRRAIMEFVARESAT
jgi:hypothetical protein